MKAINTEKQEASQCKFTNQKLIKEKEKETGTNQIVKTVKR